METILYISIFFLALAVAGALVAVVDLALGLERD